jgi:hypothetical protein
MGEIKIVSASALFILTEQKCFVALLFNITPLSQGFYHLRSKLPRFTEQIDFK